MTEVGRPTDYTEELVSEFCARMVEGRSVRSICHDEDMPSASTIFLWISKHEGFSEQYAIAKEASVEALADDILDIADNASNDWMEAHGDSEGYRQNGEAIRRSKLRVDSRKWLLSKIAPKKYGEKVQQEVSGPGGKPVETKWTVEFVNADIAGK